MILCLRIYPSQVRTPLNHPLAIHSFCISSHEGMAVYYVTPNFEGSSIRFRLDGVLSENINLSTPAGEAVNRSRTRVIWKQTELENKLHSLELYPGTSVTTLNVDAFM
jgi:hypothetical protein